MTAVQCHRAEVIVGAGRHRQTRIGKAAVGRRVDTAEAETRHRRRQIEVGGDGTQRSWIARVWHIQIVAAWQTCLNHRLQTVHKQLRIVLVLRRL